MDDITSEVILDDLVPGRFFGRCLVSLITPSCGSCRSLLQFITLDESACSLGVEFSTFAKILMSASEKR
jgi:hypothetical protein